VIGIGEGGQGRLQVAREHVEALFEVDLVIGPAARDDADLLAVDEHHRAGQGGEWHGQGRRGGQRDAVGELRHRRRGVGGGSRWRRGRRGSGRSGRFGGSGGSGRSTAGGDDHEAQGDAHDPAITHR
jgi:hypothetical protein